MSGIKLMGLDFGSTTSSALVAHAQIARHCVTGRMELREIAEHFRSEAVFTPNLISHNNSQINSLAALEPIKE